MSLDPLPQPLPLPKQTLKYDTLLQEVTQLKSEAVQQLMELESDLMVATLNPVAPMTKVAERMTVYN